MAKESSIASGRQYGNDMRRIRELHGVTLDDVYEQTRVRFELIRAFEESALFGNEHFNRVYLRAFAGRYAEAIGVDRQLALDCLDEAIAGSYSGRLSREYLGSAEDEPVEGDERPHRHGRVHKNSKTRNLDRSDDLFVEVASR